MGRRMRVKAAKSSVMRCVAAYVREKPCTVADIIENATFKSGKSLRSSRLCMTARNLAGTLDAHKDFSILERANPKSTGTWTIDPKSKLLDEWVDRKDSAVIAAKKERLGKEAYDKQLKTRREWDRENPRRQQELGNGFMMRDIT